MADEQGGVEILRVALDPTGVETGVRRGQRALDAYSDAAVRAANANDQVERGMQQVGQSGQRASDTLDRVAGRNQAAARAIEEHERAVRQLEARYREQQRALQQAQAASAAERGREQALAMAQALEEEFEFQMADIREASARGLLTPREARQRGREAAMAFNQGRLEVIDQFGETGAFSGPEGRRALTILAGGLKDVEQESRRAGVSFARLNNQMITLTRQTLGLSPAVGQVIDIVGTFAIGTTMMVGVLAGLTALGALWDRLTEKARENRERTREAREELQRLREQQEIEDLGPGGRSIRSVQQAEAELIRLAERRAELTRQIEQGFGSADEAQAVRALALMEDRNRLDAEYVEILQELVAGRRNIAEEEARAQQETTRRQQANEDLIRQAQQALVLAGLEDDARQRAAVNFDAENKLIQARRELTGDLLAETEAAIETERRLALQALSVAAAVEREAAAFERLKEAIDNLPVGLAGGVTLAGRTFSFQEAERQRSEFMRDQFDRQARRDELILSPVTARSDRSAFEEALAEALENERVRDAIDNLGDAIGSLSERAGRGIQAVRSIQAGIEGLLSGPGGGLTGALNFAAAGIGAISAASQLLGPLLNAAFGEGPLERERRLIQERNTDALEKLRRTLEEVAITLGGRQTVGRAAFAIAGDDAFLSALSISGRRYPTYTAPNRDRELLDEYLRREFGIGAREFERIAEDMGITLFDSTNNIIIPAFEAVAEAAGLTTEKLFGFGDSLDDRRRKEDIYREVYDITDPKEIFAREFGLFADAAPELFRDFGLSGIDPTTPTGARVFGRTVQDIVEEYFADPTAFAEKYFSQFASADEVFDWLLRAERAADAFTESLEKATGAVTDIPKAINLALYRRQYGSGVTPEETGSAYLPGAGVIPPGNGNPPGPTDTGPGGKQITVRIDRVINNAGDTPQDLARKMAQGAQILFSHGETLHLPGVNIAP